MCARARVCVCVCPTVATSDILCSKDSLLMNAPTVRYRSAGFRVCLSLSVCEGGGWTCSKDSPGAPPPTLGVGGDILGKAGAGGRGGGGGEELFC